MNELDLFKIKSDDFRNGGRPEKGIRYMKPRKTSVTPERMLFFRNAEECARHLSPEKNARYFLILDGSFIFGDLLEAWVVQHNLHIRKMVVSTLSMSENNVDSLRNLLEGDFVDELSLLVSDYFFSHERRGLIPYIYQELDRESKFQLSVAAIHTKMALFEMHTGEKYIFHGSANLRSAQCIEQVSIEECPELHDFNAEFLDKIEKKYKTINKSIRHSKLWQAVVK